VAGTPHANDSNSRQVVINTETQRHINLLTNTVNKILISELQHCMLTITLAKNNIINPNIFNHNVLKSIFDEQLTEVPIVSI